jgi:hypothetical protein
MLEVDFIDDFLGLEDVGRMLEIDVGREGPV